MFKAETQLSLCKNVCVCVCVLLVCFGADRSTIKGFFPVRKQHGTSGWKQSSHTFAIQLFALLFLGSGLGIWLECEEFALGSPFQHGPLNFAGSAIATQRKAVALVVYMSVLNFCFAVTFPARALLVGGSTAFVAAFMYMISFAGSIKGATPESQKSQGIAAFMFVLLYMVAMAITLLQLKQDNLAYIRATEGASAADLFGSNGRKMFHAQTLLAGSLLISMFTQLKTPLYASFFHFLIAGAAFELGEVSATCNLHAPQEYLHMERVAAFLGVSLAFLVSRTVRQAFRAVASCLVWTLVHSLIFSRSTPRPRPLRKDEGKNDKRIEPLFYTDVKGRNFFHTTHLKMKSADHSPDWMNYKYGTIRFIFGVIRFLDHNFPAYNPQCDEIRMPPKAIPAMAVPRHLFHMGNGGGWEFPHPALLKAKRNGQLLGWLVTFGPAAPMLTREDADRDHVYLDFMGLLGSEVARGQTPYGGKARFQLVQETGGHQHLELNGLCDAKGVWHSLDGEHFEDLEKQMLQAVILKTVVGRHLAGLHAAGNLVAIAIHQAFNARNRWNHPIQVWLHPHFYAHSMIHELTTPHLLEPGGVFTQIFGLSESGLHYFVTAEYAKACQHYARDCNWTERKKILNKPGEHDAGPSVSSDLHRYALTPNDSSGHC